MTAQQPQHPFSADRPITSRSEDQLARGDFAASIAAAIENWKHEDSLVVALYGAWGSGKSSVKNMVVERLRESATPQSPVTVVEFNPWQWANQDQLGEAFFQEVGSALGRVDKSREGRRRAAAWKAYGAVLRVGFTVLQELRRVIVGVLAFLAILGVSVGWFADVIWFRVAGGVVAGVSFLFIVLLAAGSRIADAVAAALTARAEAAQRSLHELKQELAKQLAEMPTPLMVVMDDVDRLSENEIRLLFQLVKANADFPNLVYLLLFQRSVVEQSLVLTPGSSGREFLDKIVQVGFDIPTIERSRLEKVLTSALDQLLADAAVGAHFTPEHWARVFVPGLRPYFRNLRDVHRFLSTLSFHVGVFRHGGSFEVNPVDLIALEVLRVFEPDIYQALPTAKSPLTETGNLGGVFGGNGGADEQRRHIEQLVARAPDDRQPQVKEILTGLFPPIAWVFGGSRYAESLSDEWQRELRVCHPDVFDRYFHYAIPLGDVSQADIDRVLALAGDRSALVAEFRALSEREMLTVMLDRLEAYKTRIDLQHAESFVTALFDIGDGLPHRGPGFFDIEPSMRAVRIVFWYLKQDPDTESRVRTISQSMRQSIGLILPVEFTSLQDRRDDKERDPEAFIVGEEHVAGLREVALAKIRDAAADGRLEVHPRIAYILYRWLEWSSADEVRTWVSRLIETDEGLLGFLKGVMQPVVSHGMGEYVSRTTWRIRLEDITTFVPLDLVKQRVEALPTADRSEDDERALAAFDAVLRGGGAE